MKKLFLILAVVFCVTVTLVACNGDDVGENKETTEAVEGDNAESNENDDNKGGNDDGDNDGGNDDGSDDDGGNDDGGNDDGDNDDGDNDDGDDEETEQGKMNFSNTLSNTKETYTFTPEERASVHSGDMLLFAFDVRAEVCTPLRITIDLGTVINNEDDSKTMEYFVPVQLSRIYMPVENQGMVSVTLETEGTVSVVNATYENYGDKTVADLSLKSGMWLLDEFEQIRVGSDTGVGAGKTTDLVKSGNYLYSIGNGAFSVTDATNRSVIAELDGFGTLRQIAITDDEKHVLITGRQDGVYIINVEQPRTPKIVATYNAIEMATGLYVSGDYAFICNRQYGVEVVDISDPTAPTHLANIHSGEVQSCVVYRNILYAGVWGQCGVYMYDLSQLRDSADLQPIGIVRTDGKGDGMTVSEINGKLYLFAATGHHPYNASVTSSLQNLAYGQGNGMDIFDVTDPDRIQWVSTVKIDGRFYYTANDYWETEVSYDTASGKYYAYLVNTYNGIYVFDVTEPNAPIRLAELTIPTALTSTVPALTHATRTIITPWDQTVENRSPVGAIVVENGVLYIAGVSTDLHVLTTELAEASHESSETEVSLSVSENFYDFDNELTGGTVNSLRDESFTFRHFQSQILAVATSEDYVYVAAGADGVLILEQDTLQQVGRIAPRVTESGRIGFATDLKIYDGSLYVAADIAGLCVYDITNDYETNPNFLWSYSEDNRIVRQVTVSPEGRFAVIQMDSNLVRIVNCQTHEVAVMLVEANNKTGTYIKTSGGNIYHHQMSTLIDDRYVGVWNHISSEYWIDFGPEGGRYDKPHVVSKGGTYAGSFNGSLGMNGGVTEYVKNDEHYALKVQGKNCVITQTYTGKKLEKLFSVQFTGKPTVCGNYLVICDRVYSRIAIYEISTGSLLGVMAIDGNPDIAYTDGTKVYIPMGYQGLLVLDTATAFS